MRTWRLALVLLLAGWILVVVPGEGDAVVPGDIGRIAFLSNADEPTAEIYIRDFAGSSPIRLTTNTFPEYLPIWSPDGSQIAFSRAPGVYTDVFVMDSDGSSAVNLTTGFGTSNNPLDWAPDGMWILFGSNRGGSHDLWRMRPDGSDPQQLTNTPDNEWGGSWSPDGSRIAFDRYSGGNSDIWLMNADGTGATRITTTTDNETDPVWSPDGARIAFVSDAGGPDVWVMNADGSNPTNLTNSASYSSYEPAWSPDGSKIAFTTDRDGDLDIWMMSPDGTDQAHLTNNPADERAVSWESVNRTPVAVDDEAHSSRGGSVDIAVLGNDSDPDGEELTVWDVTEMPSEGTVTINGDGTITYTHDGSVVPAGHANPYTDTFDYEIHDVRLGSDTGTVSIWIHPAFNDVPASNTFVEDIIWLAEQGITRGCNPPDNTLFCPDEFVTRGQMAAFLVRILRYTAGAGDDLFVDDNGTTFELDIDRIGTVGVTRGCNPPVNDHFCPDEYVTRGQMAAFLVRAFGLASLGGNDLFVDDEGSVFKANIDRLGEHGISKGCNPPTNDMFCPNDYVTREQMAAFLHRAAQSWLLELSPAMPSSIPPPTAPAQ